MPLASVSWLSSKKMAIRLKMEAITSTDSTTPAFSSSCSALSLTRFWSEVMTMRIMMIRKIQTATFQQIRARVIQVRWSGSANAVTPPIRVDTSRLGRLLMKRGQLEISSRH